MRRVPSARAVTSPEHLEVLRDRRAADGQLVGQLADGPRVRRHPLEDLATGRVGQRRERLGESELVSHDLP
jgi:hypothetical protein